MLPNIVPQFPTNMQASTVTPIVDTHCPSMVPTKNVSSNEAPMSSGNTSVSQVDEENIVPINSSTFTVTTPTGPSNTPSDNISLTPIEVVSDILDANQHEQDINTIDVVTKSLPSDEKLDAVQSEFSTPFPSDCSQPGEVLVTTPLFSETDGRQLINSSHLNAHLPIPSNIRLLSNDSMDVQNMGLP